jgi:hypothetical protein
MLISPRWEMDATNIHSLAEYIVGCGMSIGALPSLLLGI